MDLGRSRGQAQEALTASGPSGNPVTQLFDLPDRRVLAYSDLGDPEGPVVVLAHGIPGCRLDGLSFHAWASYLGIRLLTPDRPGWGKSTFIKQTHLEWADDIRPLLQGLGIARFAALGWSAGGPYALSLAVQMPENASGIALASSIGPFDTHETRREAPLRLRFALSPIGVSYRLIHRVAAAILRRIMRDDEREVSLGLPVDQKLRRDEALRVGVPAYLNELRLERSWEFLPSQIRTPVRIWHGVDDRTAPIALIRRVAAELPNGQLIEIQGGHGAPINHTEETFRWLADCLRVC